MKINLKPKLDSKFAQSPVSKVILRSALITLVIWIAIFILETILASGGLYVKGAPFIAFEIIAVLVSMLIFVKKIKLSKSELLPAIITAVLTYAILDFLMVNLLLQKNDFSIYKFWAYYLKYLIIIIVPFYRSATPKINILNLKQPLTKKN